MVNGQLSMNLYELKTKIRHIPCVDKAVQAMHAGPLFPYLYKVLYLLKLNEFSQAPAMKQLAPKSRAYFLQNQPGINRILSALADKKSKTVLEEQIAFRCYNKPLPLGTPHDQYFPHDIIRLSDREVFVDCGAFTGDSIERFQKACKNRYKKIVAFEASSQIFTRLQANRFTNCHCFNLGVWHQKDTLRFLAHQTGSDKLQATNAECVMPDGQAQTVSIEVNSIDNIPQCADMTFLKMDIEGAELNALKGAEKTIRKNRPTLAICIYHSNSDLLEIPLWIMSLQLPYTYYIRHHNVGPYDVVFYALPHK